MQREQQGIPAASLTEMNSQILKSHMVDQMLSIGPLEIKLPLFGETTQHQQSLHSPQEMEPPLLLSPEQRAWKVRNVMRFTHTTQLLLSVQIKPSVSPSLPPRLTRQAVLQRELIQ